MRVWNKSLAKEDLKAAQKELLDGAHCCRLVPGGLAGAIEDAVQAKTVPYASPQGLRLLRVYKLLLAQAERTFEDHWFDENRSDATKLTYYIPTVKSYTTSAAKLQISKDQEPDPLHLVRVKDIKAMDAKVRTHTDRAQFTQQP